MYAAIASESFYFTLYLFKDWFIVITVLLLLLKILLDIIKRVLLYFWRDIKEAGNKIADLNKYEINSKEDEDKKIEAFVTVIKDNWYKISVFPIICITLIIITFLFSKNMIIGWLDLGEKLKTSFFLPWISDIRNPDQYNVIGILDGLIFSALYCTVLYEKRYVTIIMVGIYIIQTLLFFCVPVQYVVVYCELEIIGLFLTRKKVKK